MAKKYVVKADDNLASLSRKLGVPIDEIQSYNGIRNLTPGQTIRVPIQREKKQAGYYQTGEGEQLTFSQGGQKIRLGENSSIAPHGSTNKFQQFVKIITGQAANDSTSYTAAVNGDQVSDIQRQNLLNTPKTITTGEGQYQTVTGPNGEQIRIGPNSTYTPTQTKKPGVLDSALQFFQNLSGNWGNSPTSQPASIRGSNNKGINGMFSPVQNPIQDQAPWTGGAASYAPQGWYSYADPSANARLPQPTRPIGSEYPNPLNPFTSNVNRIMQQGYYPIGSEYANPVRPQAAPFLTSQMLANPTYGNQAMGGTMKDGYGNPTTQVGNYGNYAPGNKLYSGQAITAQESFQQGNKNIGKRWWIGRGKTHGETAMQVAPTVNPLDLQSYNVQQLNWRV